MSLSAAVIDAMVAAGCTAEQLAAAMKADLADAEARKAAKRENNAERQRRFRARRKQRKVTVGNASNALRDVTPPIDNNHTPSDLSPNGENHIGDAKPKRRKSKRSADCGEPLPADWVPKLGPKTQTMADGWPPGKFDRELRKFTAHAADKGRLSKDWDAAFRTWLENADEWMPKNDRTASSNDEIQNPYARVVARREAERSAAFGG